MVKRKNKLKKEELSLKKFGGGWDLIILDQVIREASPRI